jgi:hypothetical protein
VTKEKEEIKDTKRQFVESWKKTAEMIEDVSYFMDLLNF